MEANCFVSPSYARYANYSLVAQMIWARSYSSLAPYFRIIKVIKFRSKLDFDHLMLKCGKNIILRDTDFDLGAIKLKKSVLKKFQILILINPKN